MFVFLFLVGWTISVGLIDPPGVEDNDVDGVLRTMEGATGAHHAVVTEFEFAIFVGDVLHRAVMNALETMDAFVLLHVEEMSIDGIEDEFEADDPTEETS